MYNIFYDADTKSIKLTADGILVMNGCKNVLICNSDEELICDTAGLRSVDLNIIPMIHEIQLIGKEQLEELAGIQGIWKKNIMNRQ